jgi:hypothetical protein
MITFHALRISLDTKGIVMMESIMKPLISITGNATAMYHILHITLGFEHFGYLTQSENRIFSLPFHT